MQLLPALAAEAANPSRGRGDSERNHEHQRCESGGDEGPLGNSTENTREVERVIHQLRAVKKIDPVDAEVDARVKKCKQAEHSPEFDEPGLAGKAAQRRYGERDAKKNESGVAGGECQLLNGI